MSIKKFTVAALTIVFGVSCLAWAAPADADTSWDSTTKYCAEYIPVNGSPSLSDLHCYSSHADMVNLTTEYDSGTGEYRSPLGRFYVNDNWDTSGGELIAYTEAHSGVYAYSLNYLPSGLNSRISSVKNNSPGYTHFAIYNGTYESNTTHDCGSNDVYCSNLASLVNFDNNVQSAHWYGDYA